MCVCDEEPSVIFCSGDPVIRTILSATIQVALCSDACLLCLEVWTRRLRVIDPT